MHEIKAKVERICKLKDDMLSAMECEMAKGAENVCTEEAGDVVDMIKDLCEAEEKIWKACYYKSIVEAMHDATEEEELMAKMGMMPQGRMGYDRWRRSDGEYAPKGEGHYTGGKMGFIPDPDDPTRGMEPWEWNGRPMPPYRMGYMGKSASQIMEDARKARSPRERWMEAKRYYTETGTPESKTQMTEAAKESLEESVASMRDIWADADPELREKMKRDLLNLMREMGL